MRKELGRFHSFTKKTFLQRNKKETCFHEALGKKKALGKKEKKKSVGKKRDLLPRSVGLVIRFHVDPLQGGKNVRSHLPNYEVSLQVYFTLKLGLFYAGLFSVYIFLFYLHGMPLCTSANVLLMCC